VEVKNAVFPARDSPVTPTRTVAENTFQGAGPCKPPSRSTLENKFNPGPKLQKFFGSFFQERTSFLKKRSKKLLSIWTLRYFRSINSIL
jgi:hypothetical protein